MKIEIVFLLSLIITKTFSFKDLLITDELEPQHGSLRPLKKKSKELKVELFIILILLQRIMLY